METVGLTSWNERPQRFSPWPGLPHLNTHTPVLWDYGTVGFGQMICVDVGGRVYVGRFVHSLELGQVEIVEKGCCVVNSRGYIESFSREITPVTFPEGYTVVRLAPREMLLPGLIDTHTHAPQHPNLGVGLNFQLLEWLDRVTFPTEAGLSQKQDEPDEQHAARLLQGYTEVVKEYLRNGTTTCCYFGSIQIPANLALAQAALNCGQRAFVGKVCMDCNSPAFYCESTKDSLADTEAFCRCVKELDQGKGLVQPIVTPRFAITCSAELMSGLGQLAKDLDLSVQTHLAENEGEIAYTRELFPSAPHYTGVYDAAGLLTPRTILAHSIYLSDEEQELIKERGSAISHCPNSNFALSSGIMPLRKYLDRGIKVGLGTDVSGGYSASILDAMRQAVIAAKALSFSSTAPKAAITVDEAFHLATLGGAQALGIDGLVGNFAPGKSFDAILVSPRQPSTGDTRFDFERFLYRADDRDIRQTIVNGLVVNSI